MLKSFHMALAFLTATGFFIRGIWAITDSPLRHERWVRIAPHIVDTLLLTLGIALVVQIGASFTDAWLVAKMLALLAYIGFGMITMHARTRRMKVLGFVLALVSVGYLFSVAFTRSPWPLTAA